MRLQREQKRGGDIFREYPRLLQVLRLIKTIIYKKFYFLPHSFLALLFIYYINIGKETRMGGKKEWYAADGPWLELNLQ